MIIDCLVITIVVIAMAIIFARSGNKRFAKAVLPIVILPVMYMCAHYISSISHMNAEKEGNFLLGVVIIATLLSVTLIALIGNKFHNQKNRESFVLMSSAFVIVLALIIVGNDRNRLLVLIAGAVTLTALYLIAYGARAVKNIKLRIVLITIVDLLIITGSIIFISLN